MSSINLRRVSEAAEHHDAIRGAVIDVAENSFFAFVDAVEVEAAAEGASGVEVWLIAAVAFSGAFGGTMRIGLAEPLARELFGAFLGQNPSAAVDDGPLFDLVGEFGNMVCGAWLTRSCQRRRFDLEHPEVVRVTAADAGLDWTRLLPLAVNGQPAWLHLDFARS
jgi:CheY-specific phosphatase CheX